MSHDFFLDFTDSLPGFFTTIVCFEACKEIADPEIKPPASIEIIT